MFVTFGDWSRPQNHSTMLQEEQILKLTKLKELLDAGILSEEEFAKEKAKVIANTGQTPSSTNQPEPPASVQKPGREIPQAVTTNTGIGPANVGLSSGIVLPLGIFAIVVTLISAILTGLAYSGYFDPSDVYSYMRVSAVCDFIGTAAELILWICAFNKLSTMPEGERLGRIPLWTYCCLGTMLLMGIMLIGQPIYEGPILFILLLAALVFGFVAYVTLYRTYSGKMRTYSIVWMIGMGVGLVVAIAGADLISTIIDAATYVFLMIALLEKKEA